MKLGHYQTFGMKFIVSEGVPPGCLMFVPSSVPNELSGEDRERWIISHSSLIVNIETSNTDWHGGEKA